MDCLSHSDFAVSQRAMTLVAECPYFQGRSIDVELHCVQGVLVIRGSVPTYYLKQILQSLFKTIAEIRQVDNRVDVVSFARA
jgi:hypothetical protein